MARKRFHAAVRTLKGIYLKKKSRARLERIIIYKCYNCSISYTVVVCCLLCSLSFGSYFCFDNPAALHTEFLDDLGMSESDYMGLYAWYSWPNVVLSFVGGYLIDRVFGVRLGACIFSLFCICGQFVFTAGAFSDLVWLCYVGRFIFGIGGESLAVAQERISPSTISNAAFKNDDKKSNWNFQNNYF